MREWWFTLRSLSGEARRFLCGSALLAAGFAVPWTLLNLYLQRLGFEKGTIGWIQTAEAWGTVAIALAAPALSSRLATPRLLMLSSLLAAAAYAALPHMQSAQGFFACRLVAGSAFWLHNVVAAPFLFRHSWPEARGTLFGAAEATHTLANVAGALLAGQLVGWLARRGLAQEVESMRWVLSASALFALLAAAVYARIQDPVRETPQRGASLAVLRAHRGLLARFGVPMLLIGLGAGMCIPFLNLYFEDRFDRSPQQVGSLYAAWMLCSSAGFLCSGWIRRRLGYVRAMVSLQLASIPFFLVLAFTHQLPLAVGAFLLRGAFMNTSHPISKNLAMEVCPAEVRVLQTTLNHLLWGAAWVVGPVLAGRLLDGPEDAYAAVMCATVGFYVAGSTATALLLGPLEPGRRAGSTESRG